MQGTSGSVSSGSESRQSGALVLAATPLGDSRDASPRLVEALGRAEVVAAEDTRRLRALAAALGVTVTGRIVSHYDAVEVARIPALLSAIRDGATVLLVTDAGMPAVSDPGFRLTAACVQEGLRVTCLPGPSAVTTALAVSGLPSDRFCFDGFAPRRAGPRRRWLASLAAQERTCVFFESPHRLATTLADAAEVLGTDRQAAVCRELTKTYEEVRRGGLGALAQWAANGVRGEVTVVLSGAPLADPPDVQDLVGEVTERVSAGERLKDAVAAVATAHGVPKRDLYQAAVDSEPSAADPYRWLEEVIDERALSWVRERNAETVAELTGGSRFEAIRTEIREVLDSTDRIPYITRRGEHRYNFWRDGEHPRGQWRRTTLAEYRKERPDWEILLDVDALARDEEENWVFHGAQCLRPDYRWALISLSRGGADASVLREFDIERREFVTDGFTLPEAKSDVDWIDADHLYVATDFGPGTLTTSGYPRTVRQWRRGTPLAESELVYEGEPDDVSVSAYHDDTEGFERDFVWRTLDFYRCEGYLRCGDRLRRVEVPDDAIVGVHRQWLLIELRSEWTVGQMYPPGALLVADFDEFMDRGPGAGLRVLFTPDERTSLAGYSWTRHHLILDVMRDVVSHLSVLTPADDWRSRPLTGTPPICSVSAHGTDSDTDDEYLLDVDGFLTPPTLAIGTIGAGPAEVLKRAPSFFDDAGLAVHQHFAVSEDGTEIPYFVVAPDSAVPPGGWPTLLYGYGGFEISLQPGYSGGLGRAWLARGGCYVAANIRGGGEYGPRWHSAALKGNRHRVYEDFAAVAQDLVTRGITTPGRLGAKGGSNGGLLMGVMLTRYPELFGAIVAAVPLLDMLRYHLLPAGASWIAEYGDPDDPADREHLLPFSPYHQLRADRRYPPVLLTTSTRDDRVHPGHARKLVARMREYGLPVTYYENIEGGHGGAADNEQAAFMSALAYEFLWRHLSD